MTSHFRTYDDVHADVRKRRAAAARRAIVDQIVTTSGETESEVRDRRRAMARVRHAADAARVQDDRLSGRDAHAGGDRRRARRDPRGRTIARGACGSIVEAEDNRHPVLVETERQLAEYFAGRRTVRAGAGSRRHGVSAAGVERAADDPVRRDALLRADREADRTSDAPRARSAPPTAGIRCRSSRPCHRVIGSTGALTGFAGGLDVKAHLLAFESGASPALAVTSDRVAGGGGKNLAIW